MKRFDRRGFTLIELMLVVAIIGLLAAIALPKFGNMVIKAKEAAVRGKLGSVRSALSLYYADNEGYFPLGLSDPLNVLSDKYIDEVPSISIPNTPHTGSQHSMGTSSIIDWIFYAGQYRGYVFHNTSGYGLLRINCTHTDSKGTTWSLW